MSENQELNMPPVQQADSHAIREQSVPQSASDQTPERVINTHSIPTQTDNGSGYSAPQEYVPQYQPSHNPEAYSSESRTQGNSKTIIIAVIAGLLAGLIGGVGTCGAFMAVSSNGGSSGAAPTITAVDDTTSETVSTVANQVAEKCNPSVVSVYTYQAVQKYSYDDLYNYFYGGNSRNSQSQNGTQSGTTEEELSGLGSGVILTEDGYILTNAHVIDGASSVKVKIGDKEYDATVVGADDTSDLGVLKVEINGLTPVEIADSDKARVGDWVMAIGSPYGYEKTVTCGIVSALDRTGSRTSMSGSVLYTDMIQTDAAINSGNSGGGLFNANGQLIGINTLLSSSSGSSAGIGFAINSNYAVKIANQLIESGSAEHPLLGVSIVQSTNGEAGAVVAQVTKGSSAEEAGIQANDIIIGVDDMAVSSPTELMVQVRSHEIGDEVTLTIKRDGKEQQVKVKLGSDKNANAVSS